MQALQYLHSGTSMIHSLLGNPIHKVRLTPVSVFSSYKPGQSDVSGSMALTQSYHLLKQPCRTIHYPY